MQQDSDVLDARLLLSVLLDVKRGDFSARMPAHLNGTAGKIADTVNDIISANQTFGTELARVRQLVGREGPPVNARLARGSR